MNQKTSGVLRNKAVLITVVAILVLGITIGAAALLGLFSKKDTAQVVDTSAQSDTVVVPDGAFKFLNSDIKITASESDSLGVNPSSAFQLVFSETPDERALAASLSIEPVQEFQLKKVSGKEYSVEFEQPLQGDSIYRFILSDNQTGARQSWAFQTKKILNIVRTLPRDKAVQVPLNTGIEITFSHENLENAEKLFEINPAVKGRLEWHKKTLAFVPEKLEEGTIYSVTVKKGIGIKGSDDTLAEDYTFRFQTDTPGSNPHQPLYFSFSNLMYSFTPQAAPALQIFADEKLNDQEVAVELYGYESAEMFLTDLKKCSSLPF